MQDRLIKNYICKTGPTITTNTDLDTVLKAFRPPVV